MSSAPSLRTERALLRTGAQRLACIDEVGRGSLAGPVSVGVTIVGPQTRTAPAGVRDSKLLTAKAREDLLPRLQRWPIASDVGHAGADEIDEVGILAALRVAAARALVGLGRVDLALLDGSHNWLAVPQVLIADPRDERAAELADLSVLPGRVVTKVRGDLTCAGVAAASVLAKCARDTIMVGLHERHPQYGWAVNKGYSTPEHIAALREHGPSPLHRRSWRLPGAQPAEDAAGRDAATASARPAAPALDGQPSLWVSGAEPSARAELSTVSP